MRQSLKCLLVPFALVLGSANINPLVAQTITPPVAHEFVYNTVKMRNPVQTANYSFKIAGLGDAYISTWNTRAANGTSELIYTFTNFDDPTAIIGQGSISYKNVSDIEVGSYEDATLGPVVAVAYYLNGVGHRIDIYAITNSAAPTLTLVQPSIILSNNSQYGRIRMDSHFYGVGLVWEDKGVGIKTKVCEYGTWSNTVLLAGTNMETAPDVAFSHADYGTLNLHFVYRNPSQQTIRVSKLDYDLIKTTTANIHTPTPVDVFHVPVSISNLVIDCPDHYHKENWAYTFTDGNRVFVRHIDRLTMTAPKTTIVNDGSLGNVPTANSKYTAYTPTIHYGDAAYNVGGYTGQIHVGWYNVERMSNAPFAGRGRYIGVEMNEAGAGLISNPDYMGISQNAVDVMADSYKGIAFSKNGEGHWATAPRFMYTTYFTETTPGSGYYQLHHAFHKWPDTRFRGSNTPPPAHPDCGQHKPVAQAQAAEINVFPNPFKNTLTNNVTMTAAGLLELSLTDISGRQVGSKQVQLNKGRHMVEMNNLGHLIPGTYFLSSFVDGKITGTKTVIKQ